MDIFDGIKNTKGKKKSITISLDSELYNSITELAKLLGVEKALIARTVVNNARNIIAKRIEQEQKNNKDIKD
ncbi:MAG: hypothetical protein EVJ46_00165 [Candidatus Acididesulfobacter guangdongensis]|uniref:Uncharacterized protein n=1 Tax=Acididesulfobacter guangdongensis TaxID=2597225 RepID=A0A519BHE3_ACIG2|nr:MAG: hypothetical protein EVJ46_00165 [Candidatus Acididesulfobacter guangdongensis]